MLNDSDKRLLEELHSSFLSPLLSVDGVTDISKISWGQTEDQATALGQKDESDVEDMLDLEDQAPVAGEFVVWLKADPANPTNRVIKVGETSKSLSFNFVEAGIYPVMTEAELEELGTEVSALFAMFQKPAHLRTLHRLEGYKDDTNSFAITGTKTTSDAISFDITFTNYAFDDDETYTMSGKATMTFSGTSDSTKLEASNWRIVSDQLTFASSDSSASYTAKAVDIGGQMVEDSAFGTTAAKVEFKLEAGEYANDILNIPEEDYATEATKICFGLKEFNTDSSAALVEINRTVTGTLINGYIADYIASLQQSATFF